jgi:hypothetical protein
MDGTGFDRDECGCAHVDPTEKALGDESFAWSARVNAARPTLELSPLVEPSAVGDRSWTGWFNVKDGSWYKRDAWRFQR